MAQELETVSAGLEALAQQILLGQIGQLARQVQAEMLERVRDQFAAHRDQAAQLFPLLQQPALRRVPGRPAVQEDRQLPPQQMLDIAGVLEPGAQQQAQACDARIEAGELLLQVLRLVGQTCSAAQLASSRLGAHFLVVQVLLPSRV